MASTYGYTTAVNMKIILKDVADGLSDASIEFFISKAEVLVNNKIGMRYAVPFTVTIPELISSLTQDIAAFYIIRSQFSSDSVNVNDWKTEYYKPAMDTMEAIISRKEKLLSASGAELTEVSSVAMTNRADKTPIFDVDDSDNQCVDPDLIREIGEDRT